MSLRNVCCEQMHLISSELQPPISWPVVKLLTQDSYEAACTLAGVHPNGMSHTGVGCGWAMEGNFGAYRASGQAVLSSH